MNCPNCGKKRTITNRDIFIALLVECGASTNRNFAFCECPPDITPPKFLSGNWLTESRAQAKGNIWVDIWRTHNLPQMRDCRDLNYKYAVVDSRVICEAMGDYFDITEEVAS